MLVQIHRRRTVILARESLQQNDDEQGHDDVSANDGYHNEVQDAEVAAVGVQKPICKHAHGRHATQKRRDAPLTP
jgi:hypothetical protein